ncbi:MAG: NUDIX hydrolase [Sporichthyaceae bacterium]
MSVPDWLAPVAKLAESIEAADFQAILPPQGGGARASAVLLLFWQDDERGIQILLIERSAKLRSHAGQPAFPGGAIDPGDAGPVAAALRETVEETGLDPAGVDVFGVLPDLFIPVSNFRVTPVLAWWRAPSPVHAVDEAEVAAVHAVRLADLVDPDNRLRVRHAASGRVMPGFAVNGMLVWGFTAGVLDHLIRLVGWERPWSREKVVDLSDEAVALAARTDPSFGEGP